MEHRTDHEQVEALKEWWVKNGKSVVTAIIVALAVVAAGRFWFNYQNSMRENASASYDRMLQQTQQGDTEGALKTGARIIEDYSDTTYAVLAAMAMARVEVESGDIGAAETRLRWAMDQAGDDIGFSHVARLRLARLLLQQGRADDAIQALNVEQTGAFAGAYAALRGDAYASKGQMELAENAYNTALNDPSTAPEQRNLIQLKLDNLPAATEAKEAP